MTIGPDRAARLLPCESGTAIDNCSATKGFGGAYQA